MKYQVDLHIIVKGEISVRDGQYISHLVKDKLKEEIPEISNILIHIEPNN